MKKLTYVTVVLHPNPARIWQGNARKHPDPEGFMISTPSGGRFYRLTEEGTTWARGWHTPAAKALLVALALT